MIDFLAERANYWAIIGLMMVGLYITFASMNLIKRLVGLSIFQTSVFLFYISLGKVAGGTAPILYGKDYGGGHGDDHAKADAAHGAAAAAYGGGYGADFALQETYSNPLPHVLILTAIVGGVATLSVGLALVVRIREAYGSIENDELRQIDMDVAQAEEDDTPVEGQAA